MQKQRRHHPRIKRRLTQSARVTAGDRGKIKLFPDKGHDQPRQMVLRHIVLHARRQKLRLINLPAPKIFAHSHAKNQTHSNLTSDYSDRLLGLVDAVTRVAETHVPDDVYETARQHFSEKELVDLTAAILAINAWNRLAITFRSVPQ